MRLLTIIKTLKIFAKKKFLLLQVVIGEKTTKRATGGGFMRPKVKIRVISEEGTRGKKGTKLWSMSKLGPGSWELNLDITAT